MMVNSVKKTLRRMLSVFQPMYLNIKAIYRMCKNRSLKNKAVMRVGFIAQMPEIWDKQIDVYNELITRENVEVFLFVVPPYAGGQAFNSCSYDNNYFLQKYSNAIRAIDDNGDPIELKTYGLDYVFYQRPYDSYLPPALRSNRVSAFVRCCYIPYGFSGADVFDAGNTNPAFFRNMYFSFMESTYMQKKLIKNFPISSGLKLRRIECLGYPALATYTELAPSVNEEKTVLWTPRWSYDAQMGGSHFLEYRDILFKIRKTYKNITCIFRPHPMMFDELQDKGLIRKHEVAEYLKMLDEENITFDTGKPIFDAVAASDILITDYSSIIIMFFLTGKPIIYCPSQIELNETFTELLRYMYIAETQEDIQRYMQQLCQGNDCLYEARRNYIATRFAHHHDASKRIADALMKQL